MIKLNELVEIQRLVRLPLEQDNNGNYFLDYSQEDIELIRMVHSHPKLRIVAFSVCDEKVINIEVSDSKLLKLLEELDFVFLTPPQISFTEEQFPKLRQVLSGEYSPERNVVNCTPHTINVVGVGTFDPSGIIPRLKEVVEPSGSITSAIGVIPVVKKTFGEIDNLPEEESGTILIVSALAAQAAWAKGRHDVFCPGDPVRNEQGQIIGCKSLCANPN